MPTTKILADDWEVEPRLLALGLDRENLLKVVFAAVQARNDTTSNDPANAAGWFSYSYGTRTLREVFCGEKWMLDRTDSIESILNPNLGIKVAFQNVDSAADPNREPRARSKKGAGSERAVDNNQLNLWLLPEIENVVSASPDSSSIWFLMVYVNGSDVRAELSLPISIKDNQFTDFVERIFLIKGGEWSDFEINELEDDNDSFEVHVSRK